jgi:hypothetical protein
MNRPGHPHSDGQPEPLTGPQTPSGVSSANTDPRIDANICHRPSKEWPHAPHVWWGLDYAATDPAMAIEGQKQYWCCGGIPVTLAAADAVDPLRQPTDPGLVERVAQAIHAVDRTVRIRVAWCFLLADEREVYYALARAAIGAMPTVPAQPPTPPTRTDTPNNPPEHHTDTLRGAILVSHWLRFDEGRYVTGCQCGFVAYDEDEGYGDSVIAHIVDTALAGGSGV